MRPSLSLPTSVSGVGVPLGSGPVQARVVGGGFGEKLGWEPEDNKQKRPGSHKQSNSNMSLDGSFILCRL